MKNMEKKRLGIYYIQSGDGIIDEYIRVFLKNMQKYLDELYIIVGGKLTESGRRKLEAFTDILLVEEDLRDSAQGYRAAVKSFKMDMLGEYDEVLFFNNSLMGPVCSLDRMFREMDEAPELLLGIYKETNGNKELAMSFLCFKKALVHTPEFQDFWDYEYVSYSCADFFEKKGYPWKSYIDAPELEALNPRPILFYAKEMLRDYACPFFTRESFDLDYGVFLEESVGQATSELMSYLEKKNIYDINLIWDYVLRTCHQADIVRNLHLSYVLPDADGGSLEKTFHSDKKIAMLIHIYRTDMAEELAGYALYMPEGTHVFITTDTTKKKKEIEQVFHDKGVADFEVRMIENRGRDVSSKLVGVKDVIMDYDYVCCIHDKKTPHLKPMSIGDGFGYKCFNNVIPSREYARNVIMLFEKHPRMGLAVPPEPNHAAFFTTLGLEWVGNYKCTEELAKELQLDVPLSEAKEPVAPFGSFFWFRTKALRRLYLKDWDYKDFPEEPIADDGTILHAVERIYPFVAQAEGYYPVVVMSESYAKIEYTNLRYYTRSYNEILIKHGLINKQRIMCECLDEILDKFGKNEPVQLCLKLDEQKHQIEEMTDREEKILAEKRALEDAIEVQKSRTEAMENSVSWKITSPVRKLLDIFH